MSGDVECTKCGNTTFLAVDYQPARKERRFLWLYWPAHEERMRVECYCGHVMFFKPGEIRVSKMWRYNAITGRKTELL